LEQELDAVASDPDIARALQFFNVDLDAFRADIADFTAVAPLAWNDNLSLAATTHSAGYTGWSTVGENIFAYSRSALYAHVGFFVDWGNGPNGMQDPAGHRIAILSDRYSEIGIAAPSEMDASTSVGPYVVTQNFGNRFAYDAQLVGVVINDADGDAFYDAGEGLGGVTVSVSNGASTTTWESGGYQLELAAGTYDVTFSGGALTGSITRSVTIGDENVKLDAFAADAVSAPVENLTVTGDADNNTLMGDAGNDALSGGAGNDILNCRVPTAMC